jgi:hypothetical protein
MTSVSESIPEETRIAQMKVIDKIAEIVVEKNKTLVMVEIIPSDLKRIGIERVEEINRVLKDALDKSLPEGNYELRTRAYRISSDDESKTVISSS